MMYKIQYIHVWVITKNLLQFSLIFYTIILLYFPEIIGKLIIINKKRYKMNNILVFIAMFIVYIMYVFNNLYNIICNN